VRRAQLWARQIAAVLLVVTAAATARGEVEDEPAVTTPDAASEPPQLAGAADAAARMTATGGNGKRMWRWRRVTVASLASVLFFPAWPGGLSAAEWPGTAVPPGELNSGDGRNGLHSLRAVTAPTSTDLAGIEERSTLPVLPALPTISPPLLPLPPSPADEVAPSPEEPVRPATNGQVAAQSRRPAVSPGAVYRSPFAAPVPSSDGSGSSLAVPSTDLPVLPVLPPDDPGRGSETATATTGAPDTRPGQPSLRRSRSPEPLEVPTAPPSPSTLPRIPSEIPAVQLPLAETPVTPGSRTRETPRTNRTAPEVPPQVSVAPFVPPLPLPDQPLPDQPLPDQRRPGTDETESAPEVPPEQVSPGVPLVGSDPVKAQQVVSRYMSRLQSNGFPRGRQGLWLESATSGHLASFNGKTAAIPASVTKVATSLAAVQKFGPFHRFRSSTVSFRGRIDGDTLRGDVIIDHGAGPYFLETDAASLMQLLSEHGIRQVTGRLVFTGPGLEEANGLGRVQTVSTGSAPQTRGWIGQDELAELLAGQGVAVATGGESDPQSLRYSEVGHATAQVRVGGIATAASLDPRHGAMTVAGSYESAPLYQILLEMNAPSDNDKAWWLARQVGGGALVESYIHQATQRHGFTIPREELHIADGAGYSYKNRMSPRAAVQIVKALERVLENNGLRLADVMAIGGRDGTIASRGLLGGGVAAKTGSLPNGGVSTLAGVTTTQQHEKIYFAIFNDGAGPADMRPLRRAQDRLVAAIQQVYGGAPDQLPTALRRQRRPVEERVVVSNVRAVQRLRRTVPWPGLGRTRLVEARAGGRPLVVRRGRVSPLLAQQPPGHPGIGGGLPRGR
jgi:D-alanyl-D-alanine carboxypeptidase/D-alanyl-D-alanine-endopeptidase (penicillin-binding protein 4)